MILMRLLISATVRCFGSLISVQNRMRKSCFLSWSRVSLLNRISSLLNIKSWCFSIIEISSKPFSIITMNVLNPFVSVPNCSFIRNAKHFSKEGRQSRTYSSHKKYFDYQGSYLKDSLLRDWEIRKNQEEIACRLMGVETLRYMPRQSEREVDKYQNPKTEYYNLQNYDNSPHNHNEQPLINPKIKFKTEKSHSLKQSSIFNSRNSQRLMKSSTRDMFSSDYFNNRFASAESENDNAGEYKIVRTSTFNKKQFGIVSRFKVKKQSRELQQLKQQTDESRLPSRSAKNFQNQQSQTLFLKSRGKLFYLYHLRQE